MPAFFSHLHTIKYIVTKRCLEFTSLFFFSFIAYLVLNIITSIFSAHLVGFAIARELILTGSSRYLYYISYFHNLFGPSYFRSHRCYQYSSCELIQTLGIVLSAIQILIGLMEFAMAIAASAYSCRLFFSANDHVGAVHPKSVHPGAVHPGAIGYQNPGAVMVSPGTVANQYPKMAAPEMAAPEMATSGMAAPEMDTPKLDELQIQQIEEVYLG